MGCSQPLKFGVEVQGNNVDTLHIGLNVTFQFALKIFFYLDFIWYVEIMFMDFMAVGDLWNMQVPSLHPCWLIIGRMGGLCLSDRG